MLGDERLEVGDRDLEREEVAAVLRTMAGHLRADGLLLIAFHIGNDTLHLDEWWGRILAEPKLGARVAIVLRAPLVNRTHLEHHLGRPPTRRIVWIGT